MSEPFKLTDQDRETLVSLQRSIWELEQKIGPVQRQLQTLCNTVYEIRTGVSRIIDMDVIGDYFHLSDIAHYLPKKQETKTDVAIIETETF